MWGWEKAIPREMYIHMSTMSYRDKEGILYSLSFEVLKTDIHSCHITHMSQPVQLLLLGKFQ